MTAGTPMWGRPTAPDPAVICGAHDVTTGHSGRYLLYGTGTRVDCAAVAAAAPQMQETFEMIMTVAQSEDLSRGTITLRSTDEPMIDGQSFSAAFTGQRFTAWGGQSNGDPRCLAESSVQIDFDFESFTGHLELRETSALRCDPPQEYCRGHLILDFGVPR
jgi:hypothetical protein